MNKRQETFWTVVLTWLLLLLLMSLLFSCTTTRYIEVPVTHTDTLYQSREFRDSIFLHDSTYIKEAGDTIRIERWRTQYRDRILYDTIYHWRTDTVTIAYEVPVKEESDNMMTLDNVFTIILTTLLLGIFIKLIRK